MASLLENFQEVVGERIRARGVAECQAQGHHLWKFVGGCNAGCELGEDCYCSVPVHECKRCGDCDYGDNREAMEHRAKCYHERKACSNQT